MRSANTSTTGGLTVTNLDGAPFDDRLTFNRIRVQPPAKLKDANGNLYQPPNNVVHDTASVRLTNTKSTALTINSLSLSNSSVWTVTSGSAAGTVLQPGQSITVTLKFVATAPPATSVNETVGVGSEGKTANGTYTGSLTINTSDASANKTVQLSGYLQDRNENNQEPNLVTLVNKVFGYTTQILKAGQSLVGGGKAAAVGEEILSGYWKRADTSSAVSVRQLAAYHTQGNTASLFWFLQGTTTTKTVITQAGVDGQTILPHNTAGGGGRRHVCPRPARSASRSTTSRATTRRTSRRRPAAGTGTTSGSSPHATGRAT